MKEMADSYIGVWLIGAKGGVASTAILGLAALKGGLIESVGLVSQLPQFGNLGLIGLDRLIVGGHDIRRAPLLDGVTRMAGESRTALAALVEQCRSELEQIDRRIRPGTILGVGETIAALADDDVPPGKLPREAIARLGRDMAEFARRDGLAHVVVVNVASTEPAVDASGLPTNWAELERLLDGGGQGLLPASSLYAIAALEAGHSYINFTPSLGSSPAAIDELARLRGTRHYGCDGKTGETLMKSVLAPMFAQRNLQVMSWVGHNIFGNMDGRVLDDPANKQAKADKQGPFDRRDSGLPAEDADVDRVRARPRRLEDRVGPHPLCRFPGRADDAAIHLAGLRLVSRRPAGVGLSAADGVGMASRSRSARCLSCRASSRAPTA